MDPTRTTPALPLAWLANAAATWEKGVSSGPQRLAGRQTRQRLDEVLAIAVVDPWVVIADMLRVSLRVVRGQPGPLNSETPHVHISTVEIGVEAA